MSSPTSSEIPCCVDELGIDSTTSDYDENWRQPVATQVWVRLRNNKESQGLREGIGDLQPYQDERGRGKGRASAMRPTLCKKRSIVMDIISLKWRASRPSPVHRHWLERKSDGQKAVTYVRKRWRASVWAVTYSILSPSPMSTYRWRISFFYKLK